MAEAEYKDVRVQESLRVKIGEAKNLPSSSFSGSARNTCCAIKIDAEEIFRTSTVEKSTNPFFGAEFQGEIPKKFRCLSFYVYEVGNKNKVLGKVSLKKEELYKYHHKEHWFPLTYQDSDIEVQGKVQVEVKLDEFLTPSGDMSHRMTVRVLECSDLTVINGACNPYAVVTLAFGKTKNKEVKKTSVKKKTICPQFDDKFCFYIDNKGRGQEKNLYAFEDFLAGDLSVSLFHDDSKVSREVLGNIFKGCFLGEVKIPIHDIDISRPHKAWYCLQAKEANRASNQSLGSIRLRISYTADYVFPSKYYDGLRNLILESAQTKPFTSSAVYILGEIANHRESAARENAARPLVKLFLHHGKLVPLIHALADWEMTCTIDPNTLFRGNSLLTKMVDELMKIVGLPYLHDTLKSFVDQVISESKPCEIDSTRLKDGEDATTNLTNLQTYVKEAVSIIVSSGLVCPPIMRDVFSTLKSRAMLNYPDNPAVRYHAVTSFIFLRFFTAAIMGPVLFDLYSDTLEPPIQRTFTLISKGISGLVTLVSSKSNNVTAKEEYMAPLFEMFPKFIQTDLKMFLDIISSSSGCHFKGIEAPIVLKEGFLIKRAQGRKRFGLKNFKKRFFRLSNQAFSYSKCKGDKHQLFEIPITDILAVERLEEESFKMKYMFQVVHAERALYIQANNCVEEKEWLDILTKICKNNKNRLRSYHPAAFVNNIWLCCKSSDHSLPGCTPVTVDLPLTDFMADTAEIDSDREVEKIHSIFLSVIELLDALQETCGNQAVYCGETEFGGSSLGSHIEDPSTCFATVAEIQRCTITLEQEHIQYMRSVQRRTVIGSIDTPIGDESNADLVRSMNRSSERLSRHGSRSSNTSNMSRRSFRGCRSRGGSFREREKGKVEGEGVRKSLSGDVAASSQSLGVDFSREVKKAASYDVMATDSNENGVAGKRARTSTSGDRSGSNCITLDTSTPKSSFPTSSRGTDSGIKDCSVSSPFDGVLSATDSDVFTSPDIRVPKRSTGFTPSAFLYTDDHIASFGHLNGDTSHSSENMIYLPDAHGRSLHHSDSGLNRVSTCSQTIGMLETSLDSNDMLTTTVSTNEPEVARTPKIICHSASGICVEDEERPDFSKYSPLDSHNNICHIVNQNSNPKISSSNENKSDTELNILVHKDASDVRLQSSDNSEVPPFLPLESSFEIKGHNHSSSIIEDHRLATTSKSLPFGQTLLQELSEAAENCDESDHCKNNVYQTNNESEHVNSLIEHEQSHISYSLHLSERTSEPGNCLNSDFNLCSHFQNSQHSPSLEYNKTTRVNNKNGGRSLIGEGNRSSLDSAMSLKKAAFEEELMGSPETGFSEPDGHCDFSMNYVREEEVRYCLPELTSSCRTSLLGTDPRLSLSAMTVDSNNTTPTVSPSEAGVTLEIMLTSSESDSSQVKS